MYRHLRKGFNERTLTVSDSNDSLETSTDSSSEDLLDNRKISASLAGDLHFSENIGTTRYMQLASLFRHRIATGEWPSGQRLPTVSTMAKDLGIAKITVRQAFAVLVKEGLLTSKRKLGTFVSSDRQGPNAGFRSAINDSATAGIVLSFRMLAKQAGVRPPDALRTSGTMGADYTLLRRLHVHNGETFCLSEYYVATPIFSRFPLGSEEQYKVVHLLGLHGEVSIDYLHQVTTIEPANIEVAKYLDYSFSLPVAKIRRDYVDDKGNLAIAGTSWYRGDRFVLDMKLPVDISSRYPRIATPTSRSEG